MSPRRSSSERSRDPTYPTVLYKLCQEEDVFIIPQFVAYHSVHSPRKSKDSRTEKLTSSVVLVSEQDEECDIGPPQVSIIYQPPEDKECPVGIVFYKIFVEYSLIKAIVKSLKPFSTVSTLKIENCCIGKEITEALALLLAEEPGKQITDLSLDTNDDLADLIPLFIIKPNGVRFFSLQKCSLDDNDIQKFAQALEFSDEVDHKLQVLNLGMNKIGDEGAAHLARALRTNRSLICLSLAGNRIGDNGALRLVEVLQKFALTPEEIIQKRRRVFKQILKKKGAVDKLIEDWKNRGEVDSQTSRTSIKSERFVGRKVRGPDGKIRCLSSRDRKPKPSMPKINSGEKFRGKHRDGLLGNSNLEPTPEEMASILEQVEAETTPDKHPFVTEITPIEGKVWCGGCWSLGGLNLAFNYLTEASVDAFAEVLEYQSKNFKPPMSGLSRLLLLPGNRFDENCEEFQKFQSFLVRNHARKDFPESSISIPPGSVASARRLSVSTRRMKNR